MNRNWLYLGLAIFATLPGAIVAITLPKFYKTDSLTAAFIFGFAVVGAAFLLSWACEVAQLDIPAALALSVLALIAVLPEYAVDFALTFQAAYDIEYREFAVANMIGANRMIVGFAWPLIIFLFWLRFRKKEVTLEKSQRVEVGFLGLAGFYSLLIPIKGHIDLIDVVVLVTLFVVYTFRISRQAVEEPHLIGPAETLAQFSRARRLSIVGLMLLFAGGVIFIVAHPFAEALINTGIKIGVDEVFMIQWFAPLASEAPEIVVCVLFTLRGMASSGLGALVASKVNQWTLLVGTLPLVFLLGKLMNSEKLAAINETVSTGLVGIPLSMEQVGAMFVTSGQTLLAVAIMLNLSANIYEAGLLFFLLVAQFFFPNAEIKDASGVIRHGDANFFFFRADSHWVFGTIYMVLALYLFFRLRHEFKPIVQTMFNFKKQVSADDDAESAHGHTPVHSVSSGSTPAESVSKTGKH